MTTHVHMHARTHAHLRTHSYYLILARPILELSSSNRWSIDLWRNICGWWHISTPNLKRPPNLKLDGLCVCLQDDCKRTPDAFMSIENMLERFEVEFDTFLYNLIRKVNRHYQSSNCNNFSLILEADAAVFIGRSQSLNLPDSSPTQFKFTCFNPKSHTKPLKPPFQVATRL